MLYLRFMTCLGVGLFGLGLMMVTVLDTLLVDWDVVREVQLWAARLARKHRQRYVIMGDEFGKNPHLNTRLGNAYRAPEPLMVNPTPYAPEIQLPAPQPRDLASV